MIFTSSSLLILWLWIPT